MTSNFQWNEIKYKKIIDKLINEVWNESIDSGFRKRLYWIIHVQRRELLGDLKNLLGPVDTNTLKLLNSVFNSDP